MDSTISVSKGVFLFKNGYKKAKKENKRPIPLLEKVFESDPWNTIFKTNWDIIENELKNLHNKTYSMLLNDMVDYIKESYSTKDMSMQDGLIPSLTLLTGVCQPDHVSQFTSLIDMIIDEVTPHVAMVNSQDAPTLKHLVENTVWQLINGHNALETSIESEENIMVQKTKLKKSECTIRELKIWYTNQSKVTPKKNSKNNSRPLIIIIPDFESFNCNVLQDFVMIISSHITSLPIILVFGVATSISALHKSFPYHVSSKLLIKVFYSHSSPVYMSQVLENVFLTHTSPFHMSGKSFEFLTDVFFFYDFSVTRLIQSIKYCMLNHYYGDNLKTLCCGREHLEESIKGLNGDDLECVRQLLSFRPFLEQQDCTTVINIFEDDDYFRAVLFTKINELYDYLYSFYMCVRLLLAFVKDLPQQSLGKSVREIYTKCALECITETAAFRECMQFINFQSQFKLVGTIKSVLKVVNCYLQIKSPEKPQQPSPKKTNLCSFDFKDNLGENFVNTVRVHLLMFLRQIENANTESSLDSATRNQDNVEEHLPGNRYKLKEKLLKAARVEKIQSEFEMVRSRFVSYLEDMFNKGLQPPHTQTFHEIIFFSDINNVKKQILGAPRGALHMALTNPVHYLQCSCCHLQSSDSLVNTLPDICIVYKLHLECGKHINLYDWLQAFAAVIQPEDDDEQRLQDPVIQSRFNRAVAELQFLGFIKSSKRKTDHVIRLTW